jgi:hypothetical protein
MTDAGEPREGLIDGVPGGPEKKVALVGFAETWKTAPFDDPTIEVWGLNELHKYVPRWDRWFEVHDEATLGVSKRDLSEGEVKRHLDWLRAQPAGKPIYMQAPFCDGLIPAAVPYPLERMVEQFGRYFTSSIGYMLALAIADGYTWIGLYGIDLASDIEYQQQRANAEYLIGWARGLGRTVVLATGSAICQAGHLYGYEPPIAAVGGMGAAVRNHIASLKKKHEETLATLNTLDGALQESDNFLKLMDYKERGVQVTSY